MRMVSAFRDLKSIHSMSETCIVDCPQKCAGCSITAIMLRRHLKHLSMWIKWFNG